MDPIEKAKNPAAPTVTIADYASTLLASRTQAHILHLNTESFAQHKALEDYYSGIVDLIDTLVETYQGTMGIKISGYKQVSLLETANPLTYFLTLQASLPKYRPTLQGRTHLLNIADEIQALVDQTVYKLKFLK